MNLFKEKIKKHLAVIMSVLMIVTAVPMSIFATDIASQFLTGTDAFRTNTDVRTDTDIRTDTDAVKTDTDADWDDEEDWEEEETPTITWRLDDDVLTISGCGVLDEYPDLSSITTPIKNIVIEEGITEIEFGYDPFFENISKEVETINLPKSLKYINEEAFVGCCKLRKIIVAEGNEYFFTDDMGVLYLTGKSTAYLVSFAVFCCPANIQTDNYTVLEDPQGGEVGLCGGAFVDVQEKLTVNLPKKIAIHGNGGLLGGNVVVTVDPENDEWNGESGALVSKNEYCLIPGGVDFCRIHEGITDVTCRGENIIVPSSVENIEFYYGCYADEKNIHYLGTEEQWNNVYFWLPDYSVLNVHFATVEEEKAASCSSEGYTEGIYCSECDEYVYGHETIEKEEHSYEYHNAKAPTCTEVGYYAYETCTNCDYSTYKEIPTTDHSYNSVVTSPTCESEGYTTYTCICGDSYISNIVPALGHSYTKYVEDNNATCIENGTKSAYCDNKCGTKDVQEIENSTTDHKDKDNDGSCDICSKELEKESKEPFSLKKFIIACINIFVDFVKLIKSLVETIAK